MRAAVSAMSYSIGAARLLDGIDLTVEAGELVGVIGPNGAGKSTLLRVLAGEVDPSRGSVELDGRAVRDHTLGELALKRALLPQQQVLSFGFTCLDVVMMGRHPHGGSVAEARSVALAAMDKTDTAHLADRIYTTLSGGEEARVALARVLAQETAFVLLDEPTANLDLRHQHHVMDVMRDLAHGGRAVLAVLHDVNLAARYADRIIVIAGGSVRAAGTPVEVLEADLLESVYGIEVMVIEDPAAGCPLVVPVENSAN